MYECMYVCMWSSVEVKNECEVLVHKPGRRKDTGFDAKGQRWIINILNDEDKERERGEKNNILVTNDSNLIS